MKPMGDTNRLVQLPLFKTPRFQGGLYFGGMAVLMFLIGLDLYVAGPGELGSIAVILIAMVGATVAYIKRPRL